MTKIIEKYIEFKAVFILCGIILTVFFYFKALEIRILEDPNKWLPPDNPYIKLNNEVVSHRIFPAWIYPGKVRYTVDIRPFLGRILRELTDVLSAEKVERKYLETTL